MSIVIYLIAGAFIGILAGWLLAKSTTSKSMQAATALLMQDKNATLAELQSELKLSRQVLEQKSNQLAELKANNDVLQEKLQTQKADMEAMGKKFNLEFENIANKILETKTEKFTELNHKNLKTILEPLGQNITAFKTKVEEVYDKESKERFSLGERVKELAALNKVISDEAHNLTKALKGEAKTQGNWGEMILESILEKSGLVKDREYFMEHQLLDEHGKPMKSDA
jgi:DNA recombination protein RmuC